MEANDNFRAESIRTLRREIDPQTGAVILERYRERGRVVRAGKRIVRDIDLDSGVVFREAYYLNGRLHRDAREGASLIKRLVQTGRVDLEYFHHMGRLHRADGPADIYYRYSDDNRYDRNPSEPVRQWIASAVYYIHGVMHRDPLEGPARYVAWSTGVHQEAVYSAFNTLYRDPDDGPCYVDRDFDGKITGEEYSDPEDVHVMEELLARWRAKKAKNPSLHVPNMGKIIARRQAERAKTASP
jgi:hypothetical protein